MPRSTGRTARTTNGTATSAWPTGTSHHDARQSTGGTSNVMSMPKPIVTADVAIGSIRPVSSRRPWRRAEVMASAARAPTVMASAVATAVVRSDVSMASAGSTPTRMPGRTSALPRSRHAASEYPAPARSERSTRATSGAATATAVVAATAPTKRRWRPGRGMRRRVVARRSSGRLWRRCWRAAQATAAAIASSCSTASVAAVPMSPSCVARRQISTSMVVVPTSPSTRITPYDVNVKTKMIDAAARIAGRSSGSVTSRNVRHGVAPSVAAAASRSVGR